MLKLIALVLMCIFPARADAQNNARRSPHMSLELQEQFEQTNKMLGVVDTLKAELNAFTQAKSDQCMKAFGAADFCRCIAEHSPASVNFVQYVAIVVLSREGIGYDALPPDDKGLIDTVRASRDACVLAAATPRGASAGTK